MRRLLAAIVLIGCSSSSSNTTPAEAGISPEDHVFGGDRPVSLFRAPDGADPKKPLPLVMVLHGYGAGGVVQAAYFGLSKLVTEKQFLLVAPDGTVDGKGNRFWNAIDGCCNFDGSGVDDVKYLTGLVEEIASVWSVDRKRIYLVGHSNGGAMSYRLACDRAETFAAAFVLAPIFYNDASKCAPKAPISIRHLHGTADETVLYDGAPPMTGALVSNYPSAPTVVAAWAKINGCSATPDESAPPVDLDHAVAGAETKIARYPSCRDGVATELWTMQGSTHVPMDLAPDLGDQIWSYLSAHPKP